jgi:FlaA1/EpsC-like NDP-sugar epimerase
MAAHLMLFAFSYAAAFALRFDALLPGVEVDRLLVTLPWLLALRLLSFQLFHLYEGLWRYVSVRDVMELVKAVSLSSGIFAVGVLVFGEQGFPRSVLVLDWMLCVGLSGGLRIASRLALERRPSPNGQEANAQKNGSNGDHKRAIVVGAGDVGEALLREINRGALPYRVMALVDDDPRIQGRRLHGVRVAGTIDDLGRLCDAFDAREVLLAIADVSLPNRQRIVEQCRYAGAHLLSVPGVSELLNGRAGVGQLKDVRFEELLGRSAVGTELERLREALHGRRVLVTGAAGSIGSELARQIAAFGPELVVLFDQAESDLYFTYVELRERFPDLKFQAVVGDILDEARVRQTMREYRPELVYHAAAYKHVPLMEGQPLEAIKNNVFGTELVARAAIEYGVREFVLISTDKAVRPVGVMGMSKRAAELVIRSLSGLGTTFVAVRFGNVLGSNGSVLPLFRRQIANGSPVTITDPDASRYFMLTSEAVELVLQAGALGGDGEVYVLNMGEPIRIGELAENLIRMSGFEPGVEVPIRVTGLRPGERLTEHLIVDEHEVSVGPHEKIHVVREPSFEKDVFLSGLETLRDHLVARRADEALELLRTIVSAESRSLESDLAG